MATELFASMAGIKMIHVPYKSTGAAMPELVAGQTQVMVGGMLGAQPFYESGRLRAIAVTTAKRWPSLPQLPAIAETLPGYEAGTYYGMFVPKGTPQAIIDRLNAEVNKILTRRRASRRRSRRRAWRRPAARPRSSASASKKEYDGWVKVVRETGMKIE